MMFTTGLAADTLFYSLCERILHAGESCVTDMGAMQDWASTYLPFHWGSIPWSFYTILAVSLGFMLHTRRRNKQRYSEAYRSFLGGRVDGPWGKLIDLAAVFAPLAGTATILSLVTLLLSIALNRVLGISENDFLTIGTLVAICAAYIIAMYFDMQGTAKLVASCAYLFFELLAYFPLCGDETRYIIETGITTVGSIVQNSTGMATWIDAAHTSSFPQNWTIFYWAYWIVRCAATSFLIGTINKGRTTRQIVLGGYSSSLSSILTSFIILGSHGPGLQMHGKLDLMGVYAGTDDLYQAIISISEIMPLAEAGLVLLAITMITSYTTSSDALTTVASPYPYKPPGTEEEPHKQVKLFWSILLMLLPIALIFAESSMANLQTAFIIAAFPIGFIIVMTVWSFFKSARYYLDKENLETQSIR